MEDAKLILVVDDEPRMRRFMRMNLDLEGYDVSEAGDGLTALTKVREDLPDLVLLDVMMPDMDGFETLERISPSIIDLRDFLIRDPTDPHILEVLNHKWLLEIIILVTVATQSQTKMRKICSKMFISTLDG